MLNVTLMAASRTVENLDQDLTKTMTTGGNGQSTLNAIRSFGVSGFRQTSRRAKTSCVSKKCWVRFKSAIQYAQMALFDVKSQKGQGAISFPSPGQGKPWPMKKSKLAC